MPPASSANNTAWDNRGSHVVDIVGFNIDGTTSQSGTKWTYGIYISTSGVVKNNIVYRVSEAAIHLWRDATNVIITNKRGNELEHRHHCWRRRLLSHYCRQR